jgi:two-component SAPR family response regulator
MFYLWGHSYEFRRDNNWEIIEKFAEKIGGHSDIWYATNAEIYNYVQLYKRLVWRSDLSKVFNPTYMPILVQVEDNILEIKPGETVETKVPC